jgi:hypothetical protein
VSVFLLAALPLGALVVVLLPWDAPAVPRRPWLATVFLRGVLWALPAWGAVALFRRLAGDPLTGFPRYLTLLVGTELLPLVLALAAFLLAQRRLAFPATEEGVLLTALCFLAGFLAVLDLGDFLRSWRTWDAHALFLVPLERLAAALALGMAAHRFYRWEGRLGALFVALAAAATPVLAAVGFLYHVGRAGLAWGFTGALVAGTVAAFALRYARVLR